MKTLHYFLLLIAVAAHTGNAASLFRAFPKIKQTMPHVQLCNLPTPVKRLTNLEQHLKHGSMLPEGTALFVKDDSKTTDSFGGNKPRKLEGPLGEALAKGCENIVAVGSTGSNFGCATAVLAKQLGFKACTLIYSPQLNTNYLQRNALWATQAGAQFIFCKDRAERKTLCDIAATEAGKSESKTYYIPSGASNPLGTIGFVNAAFELKEQIDAGALPCPDEIVITFGSAGSVTGLLLGLKAAGLPCHVITACVVSDPDKTAFQDIADLYRSTNDLLQTYDSSFPRCELTPNDVTVDWEHYHGEYAKMGQSEAQAITLLNETENIKTDGTYAGKAVSTLIDYMPKLAGKKVLLWNTFCSGDPANLEMLRSNYQTFLDPQWSPYFDGTIPLQPLDQGI
ncbi:pyridoxal-phosphate dependent enzyme [Candidatus Dependentiae bacterium]|nr:pyridoxal-phosphate dependent enzyme [Candidatus Dependentiae bacterium]